MMKTTKIGMLGLMLSILFIGCAGSDSSSQHKKEVEDNQKLEETFSAVTGTYAGEMKTSSGLQDVKLVVYTLKENAGFNSDGSERFRLSLKGNFKVISPPGPATIFSVQYIPETSALNFISTDLTPASDDIQSIDASISGENIVGNVKRLAGVLGNISLHLASHETGTSDQGETNDYYARLRQQYLAVAGTYSGTVTPPEQVAAPFRIQVRMLVTDTTVDGYSKPILFSYYHRHDDSSGILDLTLDVTYRPDITPPPISLSGKGTYLYFINIQGNLSNNAIRGTLTTRNYVANVVLTKDSAAPLK